MAILPRCEADFALTSVLGRSGLRADLVGVAALIGLGEDAALAAMLLSRKLRLSARSRRVSHYVIDYPGSGRFSTYSATLPA